jgi:hypothetical protein
MDRPLAGGDGGPRLRCKRPRFGPAAGRVSTKKSFFAVVGTGVLFSLHGTRQAGCAGWSRRGTCLLDPAEDWRPSTLGMVFPDSSPAEARHRPWRFPFTSPRPGGAAGFPTRTEAWISPAFRSRFIRGDTRNRAGPLLRRLDGHRDDRRTCMRGSPVVVLGYPAAFDIPDSPRAIVRQGIVSWVSPAAPRLRGVSDRQPRVSREQRGAGLPAPRPPWIGLAASSLTGGAYHAARHRDPGPDSELAPAGRRETGGLSTWKARRRQNRC